MVEIHQGPYKIQHYTTFCADADNHLKASWICPRQHSKGGPIALMHLVSPLVSSHSQLGFEVLCEESIVKHKIILISRWRRSSKKLLFSKPWMYAVVKDAVVFNILKTLMKIVSKMNIATGQTCRVLLGQWGRAVSSVLHNTFCPRVCACFEVKNVSVKKCLSFLYTKLLYKIQPGAYSLSSQVIKPLNSYFLSRKIWLASNSTADPL